MSIDVLQEKIRKLKNPSMIDLALKAQDLPPQILAVEENKAKAYGRFCREVLETLKGLVPAVRVGFTAFAVLGAQGLTELVSVLEYARREGYYVVLEAPQILSPMMAEAVAQSCFGEDAEFPCDGLIVNVYPGTDVIKPFLPYVKKKEKALFPLVRTSNKTAPELQDLMTGSRLVHTAAADLVNRFGGDVCGKCGYASVGAVAGGSLAESLRTLRQKYTHLFLLVDDIDYSNCNSKICSEAFDQFGYGAVVCAGPTVTCAWQLTDSDGSDYRDQALAAAERMKKNLTRYTTIL